ncbi:MAG: hypothetical protein LJE83_09870 [Gammaproteobacteria bacterium]|nr:hypothetical protein [Gammaproteobacteria bacterium]
MNIQILQEFFLWCMLLNTGIYALTAVAVLFMCDFICSIHKKMFGFDEATVLKVMQKYMANYKLLITVFNFVPWVALLVIDL